MSSNPLTGKRIAILATDGFEQSELMKPKQALSEAGAEIEIVSLKGGAIKGWDGDDWGESVSVDKTVAQADADDYDALVLPGGAMNPDKLRTDTKAVGFIRAFMASNKPVAAICHAPWTLIEGDLVRGRTMTSYPSIQTDCRNAGANWVDQPVVEDRNLITSRNPDDIPLFNDKIIEVLSR